MVPVPAAPGLFRSALRWRRDDPRSASSWRRCRLLRPGPLFLLAGVIGSLPNPSTAHAAAVALGLHSGSDNSITQYEAFGAWLGRKVTHRVVFADMSSWSTMAAPWFLNVSQKWVQSDPARVEIITMPLLPTGEAGNFAAIIRGDHDATFTTFGQNIKARNMAARVIVRLGWEGNGDWYPWSYAADPAGYRDSFRRAAQLIRQQAPGIRFDWCVSCGASHRGGPALWTDGYPGDDVVDIVSMDVYDQWWSSWTAMRDGEAGLGEFRNFAVLHQKPEAYPEWSCSTDLGSHGGGDNPTFVQNLAAWFAARPGQVVYHGYWNTSNDGPNAAIYGTDPILVPNAAAAYQRIFTFTSAPAQLIAR